jgi:hypothetical protein
MSLFRQIPFLFVALTLITSCKPFDVNVATPEPIKVDLDMDVHVYQHGKVDKKTSEQQEAFRSAMDARRARMEEIQELKNNRLVGENHEGELSVRTKPAGEYGDYVVKTVSDENLDRVTLTTTLQHAANPRHISSSLRKWPDSYRPSRGIFANRHLGPVSENDGQSLHLHLRR